MYHYNAEIALEELTEEAVLPNPVHVRDMIVRAQHSPGEAIELNRRFQSYLQSFGDAQSVARQILEDLVGAAPKL